MAHSDIMQFLALLAERYISAVERGVVILGSMYLLFWVFKRPWMDRYRVPTIASQKAKPAKEAMLTMFAYIIYSMAGAIVLFIWKKSGYTVMYLQVSKYGWTYTIGSFFIFLFYTDTTFYWSHVLMHKSKLLFRAHATHHQFINVTPLAAYAFNIGEAVINSASFMMLMLILPWHPLTLFVFVVFSVFYNGLVHLGYELFPKSWRKHSVMKWMNTTTHHIYHHQKSDCNYSFIFTFWDKWMKTERLPG